jgi:hypothetical protein
MPDPGATDPADLQAPARVQLGLTRQLEQTHHETPHRMMRLAVASRGFGTSGGWALAWDQWC